MEIFAHFAGVGVSNSFLISQEPSKEAIIVDPGRFDVPLLKLVEENDLYIKSILVTHDHNNHSAGLKTIMKIYNSKIYSVTNELYGYPCTHLKDGDILNLCGLQIEVISINGHSGESIIYKIGNAIFTGDVLSAGRIGTSSNEFSRQAMKEDLKNKIFNLSPCTVVFPGHGPPSTLKVETNNNSILFEENPLLQ